MMVKIGNFFFHYRNILLPIFFLLILVPSPELFTNPTHALIIGFGIAITGQLIRFLTIGLVYIIRGGHNRRIHAEDLVSTGIFAHCRNPLYVGNIGVAIGMGVASNSILFFSFITPMILFIYIAIVAAEENFLRNKFGASYDEYTHRVNRWLPNLNGIVKTFQDHRFSWKRVLLKEYNSTYVGIILGFLLVIKSQYEHPELYGNFKEALPTLGIWMGAITFVYLLVKVLKKTHTLVAD
jgi:protein-S-isoprenylcysteine O-methyltransferase Ste14